MENSQSLNPEDFLRDEMRRFRNFIEDMMADLGREIAELERLYKL